MGELQDHHMENVGDRETHRVDPEHHERFRDPERIERLRPRELVQELDLEPGETVIDLGCGDGLFFEPLSEAVGSAGSVVGLDIEPEMIEVARMTARDAGLENVSVETNRDDRIDLDENSVDAAILVNALHEMAYPNATLGELQRVLKPTGRILVFDRRKEETGDEGPPIHHLVSREEALGLLEEAGFQLERNVEWDPDMYCFILTPGS